MKKTALFLVTILVLSALLTGCGQQTKFISVATGGTTGTYYPLGGAMAKIFTANVQGVQATAESTGASIENINLIKDGKVELAMIQNDAAYYAYSGTGVFDGKKVDRLRGVTTLYPETVQFVALADSGINTIADLKGKRVAVGASGSINKSNVAQILEQYGLTFDDIKPDYMDFGEASSNMKDGHLDASFVVAGHPTAAIQDLAASRAIKILPIEGAQADSLIKKYPFYTKVTIPAGTYPGQTAEVNTVAVRAMLVTSADLSDNVVYELTKALFSHLDLMAAAHKRGAEIKLETAQDGMSIPLHPGAEKFFKEAGK